MSTATRILRAIRPLAAGSSWHQSCAAPQLQESTPWGPMMAAVAAAGCMMNAVCQAEKDSKQEQALRGGQTEMSPNNILLPSIIASAPNESPPDLAAQLSSRPEIVGPCMLSLPLGLMLGAAAPLDTRTAAALARALPSDVRGLQHWEVSGLMRGAALLLGPSLQAWALAVMCGGLPEDVLAAVQSALRARRGDHSSEAGQLLLLDALLLTASRQWRQQHPTASTQPAQGGLSSAAPAPRPSKEAVAALAAPASTALSQTMAKLYTDHVPLEGYFYGGALHTVLHSALVMPHICGDSQSSNRSSLCAAFGCILPESCGAAAAAVSGLNGAPHSVSRIHKEGARVRRDLQLHWRQDQLVDERQRAVNDVTHLLEARVGETVQQPADLQIVLPMKKLVLVLEDDASTSSSPFTLSVGCACLERLCLERFSPQVRVQRAATAPGLAAAREAALEAGLGWKLVKVPPQEWRTLLPKLDSAATALRGRPIMAADPEDLRALRVLQGMS
ncbi:hypothetical protein DUNSADRAFT_14181 [Dunaliella salina]|uniref:Uncharacterized protein n=1 Tax=Dunaliella salina TaxID=3046 RepID=A0ABQ7G7W7_DUNSA|nr:hypothetical protein DUNSADRAFT_14181 [Dunaliella salina]|eukprot:KAF5830695.1 hypothetical protein DUNSADRAFT_14181 [Dunaliella salina]